MPKKIDDNSDNSANIDLLTFCRKQFNQVLDTLLSLSNQNLKVFIEKLKPIFSILRIPLKFTAASPENLEKTFSLFLPESKRQAGYLLDFDAVAAEWEILCHQCSSLATIMELRNLMS